MVLKMLNEEQIISNTNDDEKTLIAAMGETIKIDWDASPFSK